MVTLGLWVCKARLPHRRVGQVSMWSLFIHKTKIQRFLCIYMFFYPILFHFKACTILLTDVPPNKFNSKKRIIKKRNRNKTEKNVSAGGLAKLGDRQDRKNEETREIWIILMSKEFEDITEYTK